MPAQLLNSCPEMTGVNLYLLDIEHAQIKPDPDVIRALFDAPPFWSVAWPSGRILAQLILNKEIDVVGKTVLDFGCGSGLVAIAAALAGARRVVACDADKDALLATQENASLNDVDLEFLSSLDDVSETVDYCIVADVFYDPENLPLLPALTQISRHLVVADCRAHDLTEVGLDVQGKFESAVWPDVDPSDQFRAVTLYQTCLV